MSIEVEQPAMRKLDGADAGGQFVRTALTLSVVRNEPIRIENIRGDRSTPGLRHQHLAVVETMAELCDANVSGAELGGETISFDPALGGETGSDAHEPGRIAGGSYSVDIGTAGSMTLLFDALLPLATVLDAPLSVTATGGTDVKWSPPMEYFRAVKLPLVGQYGLVAACDIDRRGFYPDGGGRATLRLAPAELDRIELTDCGSIEAVRCFSTESQSLADRDVAHRQVEGAHERLSLDEEPNQNGELTERRETTVASHCPGSAVVIRVDHDTGSSGFTALGERGTPAERVGEDAADAANRWLESGAAVDRHMADQLLVILALAGGRLRIPTVTDHVRTSCDLLDSFGLDPILDDDGETTIVSIESPVSVADR